MIIFATVAQMTKAEDATPASLLPYLFPSNITEIVCRRDFPDGESAYYHLYRSGNNLVVKGCESEEDLPGRHLVPRTRICGRTENYVWANMIEDSLLRVAGFDAPTNAKCRQTYQLAHVLFRGNSRLALACLSLGIEVPLAANAYAISNNLLYYTDTYFHCTNISGLTLFTSNSTPCFKVRTTNLTEKFTSVYEVTGTLDTNYHLLKQATMRQVYPKEEPPGGMEILSFQVNRPFNHDVFRPEYHIAGGLINMMCVSNNALTQVSFDRMPKTVIFMGRLWREKSLHAARLTLGGMCAAAFFGTLALLIVKRQKRA